LNTLLLTTLIYLKVGIKINSTLLLLFARFKIKVELTRKSVRIGTIDKSCTHWHHWCSVVYSINFSQDL